MINLEKRIASIEESLNIKTDPKEALEKLTEEELSQIQDAVDLYLEEFGDKPSHGIFEKVTENAVPEERIKALLNNFTHIVIELILSMHRKDDNFLNAVREIPALTIAYRYAEGSFKEHATVL